MHGRLIAPVPGPGEEQKYFHDHMGNEVELEAGETDAVEWAGLPRNRTVHKCPECGQQVEQLSPPEA